MIIFEGIYSALISVNPWTFIVVICNLFIQMYIIKRFLLDKVFAVLDARKEAASAQIAQAKQAKEEADAMKAEYTENLANAKAQADEIVSHAQKVATVRGEELVSEARTQASQMKQKAEADIQQEKKKAINEIKDEIGGMAMEIAAQVVERELNENDHKELIDQFIKNVGDAS